MAGARDTGAYEASLLDGTANFQMRVIDIGVAGYTKARPTFFELSLHGLETDESLVGGGPAHVIRLVTVSLNEWMKMCVDEARHPTLPRLDR